MAEIIYDERIVKRARDRYIRLRDLWIESDDDFDEGPYSDAKAAQEAYFDLTQKLDK